MSKSFHALLEEKCYEVLGLLEDELGIRSGKIPETYYIGKRDSFERLWLDSIHEADFDYVKKSRRATTFLREGIIFSGTLDREVLAEECGHFLHFLNSDFREETIFGRFYFGAITEMLGFFASKLINPNRKNPFSDEPDLLGASLEYREQFEKILEEYKKGFYAEERLIYSQGYGMGERLYNYYISELISPEGVQSLFEHPINSEVDAALFFNSLKYKILI